MDAKERESKGRYRAARAAFIEELAEALTVLGFTSVTIKKPNNESWRDELAVWLTKDVATHIVTIRVSEYVSGGMGRPSTSTGLVTVNCCDVYPRRTFNPTISYKGGNRRETPVKVAGVAAAIAKAFEQKVAIASERLKNDAATERHVAIAKRVDSVAGAKVTIVRGSHAPPCLRLRSLDEAQMTALVSVLRNQGMLGVLEPGISDDSY